MDLPALIDAAAVKAANVTGMKGAWGVAAGVEPPPETPWAVVYLASGTAEAGMATLTNESLEIRVYMPFASPSAYAVLAGMPDLFETEWRTGTSLGDETVSSTYAGYGSIARETWAGTEYLTIPIRIAMIRIHHATLTA